MSTSSSSLKSKKFEFRLALISICGGLSAVALAVKAAFVADFLCVTFAAFSDEEEDFARVLLLLLQPLSAFNAGEVQRPKKGTNNFFCLCKITNSFSLSLSLCFVYSFYSSSNSHFFLILFSSFLASYLAFR